MAHIHSRKHAVVRALPPLGSAAAATLIAFGLPAAAQQAPNPATQNQARTQTETETPVQSVAQNTLPEIRVEGTNTSDYKVDRSASPKFTAPLVDTPQTVQVITHEVMRQQGVTSLTEALRNTPGAGTFFLGENGSTSTGDAIYLRGYDTSGNIFVDGIRDTGAITRDTFNIQQVEVVKGPAGTDTGRTSPTGYINMIAKKPELSDFFDGSVSIGSDGLNRETIDWNKVISGADGSGTAFRLNAVNYDANTPGRDKVDNTRRGIAPSIAIGLNSPTRIFLDYVHVEQNNVPDGGVPTIGLPGYTTPDPKRGYLSFAAPVDSSNFYGTTSDFDHDVQDMFTARFEHDISPDVTLRNTFRYARTTQDYMLTSFMGTSANLVTPNARNPLGWTLARSNPTNRNQDNTILADQVNVSAMFDTAGLKHSLNAGVEIDREEQDAIGYYGPNATVFGVPGIRNSGSWPAANLHAPDPDVNGYLRIPNGTATDGTTTTVSAYAFDTVKLTGKWSLTGGLRFDHYTTDYAATALNATSGVLTPSNYSTSGDLWTGKLGVVYKPTENSSVYAAYGTADQPPGGANFQLAASGTGNSPNRTDFLPQKSSSTELGTKWDVLDKQLSLTAALYRTDISNQVVQDPTTLQYYQTGKQRVQGVELGVAGAITDLWNATAGFTTQNSEVVSGPSLLADGSSALAYTPRKSFTSWTTYQLPGGVMIGGGARYIGQMYRGTDGAIGTPAYVDAYWVFDAMASYRVNKHLELVFNVYNLGNKDYVAAINKSGYRYIPGQPRTFRLTANVSF